MAAAQRPRGRRRSRAEKLEHAVRELLQIVVIDLTADENAQEIFETLNARGAQLTAADLIKNFVFQRLMEAGVDVEAAYERHWKEFETGFWEAEVSFGRLRYSRSSIFLNHWLIARTGEEIVAREVFARFKRYADFEADVPMAELRRADPPGEHGVPVVHRGRDRRTTRSTGCSSSPTGRACSRARCSSRSSCGCSIPSRSRFPSDQLRKALDVLESWLVRRMLVRAQTKLVHADRRRARHPAPQGRAGAAPATSSRASSPARSVASRYWPDDDEVTQELTSLLAYQRLRRGRLRMVLEAIEDHRRGWHGDAEGLGGERVARGQVPHRARDAARSGRRTGRSATGDTEADRDDSCTRSATSRC